MLEASIPLLTPEYIEQLNSMVVGIMQQNKRKLEESFNNIPGIQNSTILSLYNLTVQQWTKKQKIIDNLCHFCLTMMSTVQILWQKRQQSEQKVSNSNLIIEDLKRNIEILNEQNQHFKLKINQAETHIQSISGQKERIQQIYRSQSCIDFSANECFSELNICCKKNSEILENSNDKDLALKQKNEILLLKQSQISSLIEEKSELEKKIEELYEQNQLYRIEVQLAEIAVKDALSYKSVSITNRSELIDNKDDYFANQAHRNGEIQCFSNSNQSYILNKNILDYELSSEERINFIHYPSSPFLNQDILNDNSCMLSTESQCQNLRTQRAFKRKNNFEEILRQKLYTEQSQCQISKREQIQNIHGSNNSKKQQLASLKSQINPFNLQKKTVSLQCNLLKNVPKLNFFIKSDVKVKNKETSNLLPEAQNNSSQSFTFEKISNKKGSNKVFSNKKISKDMNKTNLKPAINQLQQQNSLSKLYNLISTKLVTQRIKGIKGK